MLNVRNRAKSLVPGIFVALLVPMCTALLPARVSAAEDSIEIRNNLPLLLQTPGSMPFSSEGSGPVVYVVEFSTCPYARRFESDYGAKLAGMGFQVRRLFYGVDQATQNNAAAAALSRDPAMQRAFMFDGLQAPSVYASPAALEAYYDVPEKLKVIVGVLHENGWSTDRVVSMRRWLQRQPMAGSRPSAVRTSTRTSKRPSITLPK